MAKKPEILLIISITIFRSEYNFVVFGNATTENNQTTVTVTFKTDTQQSKYYVLYNDRETALVYSCAKEPAELRGRPLVPYINFWTFEKLIYPLLYLTFPVHNSCLFHIQFYLFILERSWILNRYNNVSRDVMLNIEAVIDDQGSGFRERLSGMKYCGGKNSFNLSL